MIQDYNNIITALKIIIIIIIIIIILIIINVITTIFIVVVIIMTTTVLTDLIQKILRCNKPSTIALSVHVIVYVLFCISYIVYITEIIRTNYYLCYYYSYSSRNASALDQFYCLTCFSLSLLNHPLNMARVYRIRDHSMRLTLFKRSKAN